MFSIASAKVTSGLAIVSLNGYKLTATMSIEGLRKQFALEAFRHTAEYDTTINRWMEDRVL